MRLASVDKIAFRKGSKKPPRFTINCLLADIGTRFSATCGVQLCVFAAYVCYK